MAESKEELKNLLIKVKEENEKSGLKLNIKKMKIMASSPISLWQIDRKTMETVTDFILGAFLLLGRQAMTSLDSVLKSRNIALLTKVCLVKTVVFPCMDMRDEP